MGSGLILYLRRQAEQPQTILGTNSQQRSIWRQRRGKDVKTIQELLRHAKASTTLDLYSQAIDAAKLAAQEEIALAIKAAKPEVLGVVHDAHPARTDSGEDFIGP